MQSDNRVISFVDFDWNSLSTGVPHRTGMQGLATPILYDDCATFSVKFSDAKLTKRLTKGEFGHYITVEWDNGPEINHFFSKFKSILNLESDGSQVIDGKRKMIVLCPMRRDMNLFAAFNSQRVPVDVFTHWSEDVRMMLTPTDIWKGCIKWKLTMIMFV